MSKLIKNINSRICKSREKYSRICRNSAPLSQHGLVLWVGSEDDSDPIIGQTLPPPLFTTLPPPGFIPLFILPFFLDLLFSLQYNVLSIFPLVQCILSFPLVQCTLNFPSSSMYSLFSFFIPTFFLLLSFPFLLYPNLRPTLILSFPSLSHPSPYTYPFLLNPNLLPTLILSFPSLSQPSSYFYSFLSFYIQTFFLLLSFPS